MNRFELDLSRSLGVVADDVGPEESRRVVDGVGAVKRSRSRRYLIAASLAAAVGSVVLISMAGLFSNPERHTTSSQVGTMAAGKNLDFIPLDVKPGEPCAFAQRGSLEEVASRAEVPIWLPNRFSTGAWTCGADAPVVTFGSIRVFYEPGWSDVDVSDKWTDLANDYGGYVDTILDRPAFVQPITADSTNSQVMVVNGDVLIRVLGDETVPIEALVGLASSINLTEPVDAR